MCKALGKGFSSSSLSRSFLSKQNSVWEEQSYKLQYKLINALKMRLKPPALTNSGAYVVCSGL